VLPNGGEISNEATLRKPEIASPYPGTCFVEMKQIDSEPNISLFGRLLCPYAVLDTKIRARNTQFRESVCWRGIARPWIFQLSDIHHFTTNNVSGTDKKRHFCDRKKASRDAGLVAGGADGVATAGTVRLDSDRNR
jgi:hypothetical protein